MLDINGIPPKLSGRECEELVCQQYWQNGKLVQEMDVLYIKSNHRWYQLYFEDDIIFWRNQKEGPNPFVEQEGVPFRYPLIDLGVKYGIKNELIDDYIAEPMVNGSRVVFTFESDKKLYVSCVDNQTSLQLIKQD